MRFVKKSLMVQLVIYFLLLSVVTVGLVGYVTFLRARETLKQAVFDQLETIATLKEDELGRWVGDRREDVLLIATLPEVQSQVEQLLKLEETDAKYQAAFTSLSDYLAGVATRKQDLQEILILSARDGRVILSTDKAHEGESHADADYFVEGQWGPSIQSVYVSPATGKPTMTIATPLLNEVGLQLGGVLVVHLNLERMDKIVLKRAGLEDSSRTYLVDRSNALVSAERFGEQEFPQGVHSEGIDAAMQGIDGSGLYPNYEGVPVIGVYRWIGKWDVALLAEMDQQQAFAPAGNLAQVILLVGLISAGALAAGVYLLARQIARPILTIADTAVQVAAGDLDRVVEVKREDEIGVLAQAFNSMTTQLRELIGSLERRVAERTQDLEQRSAYLEATAEVGRAASSILETDQLIHQVVDLIRERFGLYFVGLFMLDASREWAVLQAGTGQAGQSMAARGHRIRVGEGMTGWSIAHAQPRVALEAEEDAVRLVADELPDTRSEAALPLRSRGRVIGVLNVQHTEPGAFDEDTIVVLQTMADQVAVSLENARLFVESQDALDAARRAYGESSREAWADLFRAQPDVGYRSDEQGVTSIGRVATTPESEPEIEQAASDLPELTLPITIHDQVLGTIQAHKADGDEAWTAGEIALMQALGEQLSVALESARLYQDTQQRAARDRLLGDVTARVRETLDVDTVLQTAVREIGEALNIAEVEVRMGTSTPQQPLTSPAYIDDGHEGVDDNVPSPPREVPS